ncbi:unnamed protein product [Owenia fusiformis]|uniref:Uncharacterized protein n=1 Tax=Owenia fusiformis TaxID=6347 RepID=A0A8S4N2D4_OWEFU|nr:unnamed protein product [Owenia fusiformis]
MYQSLSFGFRLFESKYCALTKCVLSERAISLFISSQLASVSPGFSFFDLVNMLDEYQFTLGICYNYNKYIQKSTKPSQKATSLLPRSSFSAIASATDQVHKQNNSLDKSNSGAVWLFDNQTTLLDGWGP